MTEVGAQKAKPPLRNSAAGRLFVLELSAGCVRSMRPDGTDRKVNVLPVRGIAQDAGLAYLCSRAETPALAPVEAQGAVIWL
jgi:hypothetical protein